MHPLGKASDHYGGMRTAFVEVVKEPSLKPRLHVKALGSPRMSEEMYQRENIIYLYSDGIMIIYFQTYYFGETNLNKTNVSK